ncbi:NACHT, LRR and PYD domains-containing protein 12-like [Alligator mississippiensis]|uniref:NACHT, LRR and PYD domains-containing protein 12-like n=1 Tax=Alligator mississippiensis TaxID=8496 RepID=A0A151P308_ALLMI|nr:NACHT, LRR and PYD domains-containing protein 12-like [Alligator mississippiensis]
MHKATKQPGEQLLQARGGEDRRWRRSPCAGGWAGVCRLHRVRQNPSAVSKEPPRESTGCPQVEIPTTQDRAMETAMKLLNMFSSHEGAGKIKDEKDRGYRQKYMEHVQHRFRLMKDLNARLGENVLLDHRYTKLIIVEDCLHKDLREQDVMAWGSAKIGKGQKRSISMVDFFKADEDGQTPQIVLLVGPAAIGKTMTAKKIMLDWASERLYQKKFEYSFYISCWTLNLGSEQASIVDLILKNCPNQVVLSFCLRHAPKLESLGLKSCEFQFGDLYDFPRQQKQVPLDPRLSPIYLLCQALKDPSCNLKTLKLWWCSLTGAGYKDLANVLCSPRLAELELGGDNSLEDTSVQQLCKGLKHPSCRLRRLRLWSCRLTGACCGDLASVLISNMHLTELDLRGNLGLGDHGMQKLCDGLRHPRCMLQRLRLRYCSLTAMSCLELAQVLSTSQALQELDLGRNKLGLNGMKLLCKGLMHASCRLKTLVLRECSLRADSCHEMALALGHPCALVELDLQDNQLGMAGVEELCQGLRQPGCQLQTLWLSPHTVTEEMWPDLRTIKEAKPGLVIKSHE